ncbi:MAG TPA: hypothetical protein VJQ56_01780 [Blastocatellia bacterium]|nr:hypothetical protein [Blastocatellia bacterium]
MEKRHDDRDAEKADDRKANERDENQQAAELQVGEEDERANPSRFEPDPEAEKQPIFGES